MSREIDIVGAGLVAGMNLAGQGFKVRIHEAKNTIGGEPPWGTQVGQDTDILVEAVVRQGVILSLIR